MSGAMSPYQPPQAEMPQKTVQAANVSVVPKVFGILHLVFGGLGLAFEGIGVVGLLGGGLGDVEVWDVVFSVGPLVLSVLLVVSGVMLVQYRRLGRQISNVYSGLSVMLKLFGVLFLAKLESDMLARWTVLVTGVGKAGEGIAAVVGGQAAWVPGRWIFSPDRSFLALQGAGNGLSPRRAPRFRGIVTVTVAQG